MRYRCPNQECGKVYEKLTQDECCDRISCFGEKLVPYAGEGESTIEGLCLLVCDASFSMDEKAFPKEHKISKLELVTRAVNRAIIELWPIGKADTAFIGLIAFGGRAAFFPDRQGKPILMSVKQFQSQFDDNLDKYIYQCVEQNRPDIDREHTDITEALRFAFDVYSGAMSGNLGQFGIRQTVSLMEHTDIYTYDKRQISVPNARVMIYSDGAHNPPQNNSLSNKFSSLQPSPLMAAFIGDESTSEDARKGADQMKEIANICPAHGQKGYFLINTPERYAVLRGVFRMASGASGFCPQCLKGIIQIGEEKLPSYV